MRIEEEADKKNDSLRLLSKAQSEIQLWKSKYETEALGRIDELEGSKAKLGGKVTESEESIDSLNSKIATCEKAKHRLEMELEDCQLEYERVHAAASITEKRGHNFDRVLGEWKAKADDLMSELEACKCEGRNYGSEVYRLKSSLTDTEEQLDVVRRENKNLAEEIKDLLDQLGDGGRSIHELDKQRRRLEVEKEELQGALEEAESSLEQEENKVLRAALELAQVKQEIDRRIAEKEDEFENSRKNHARAMDSMQASLEAEQHAKAEAVRMKKKIEGDINELEEARALHESAERGKRQTESELAEARSAVIEMTSINSKANSDKRAIEGAVHTMQAEVDEILQQAKGSEDKSKKAMVDAARLADELRAEQDHTNSLSKAKRTLETQLHDLEAKFQDANENAIRGGRTAMAKLESRIRELEVELGNLQSKTAENQKAFQKSERRVKEVLFQNDEDRMTDLASKLQGKIKTYKKQIEDAEEIAALNLAKFHKAQQELEECEERARTADAML